MPRVAMNRPTEPWVPASCTVTAPKRGVTTARPTKAGPGKSRPSWDVVWRVDGLRFFQRFFKASEADVFAEELKRGFYAQMPFDPVLQRFQLPAPAIDPADLAEVEERQADTRTTVMEWTQRYWDWKWPNLEPKPRAELARYLNRAREWFVTTKPTAGRAAAVAAYLSDTSLVVAATAKTDEHRIGESWLVEHSMPLDAVGREELQAFVDHYRRNQRYPDREVSVATQRRMLMDLKQCWARAVHDDVLTSNPWERIELNARSSKRTPTGKAALMADAELVLSPEQIVEMADACVSEGSWDASVRAFVLVMGFCGLRPNEAVGLVLGDVELPTGEGHGWVTVRRTKRTVHSRYIDASEDAEWGPLKGRDLADTRRVPVPTGVVDALRTHIATYRADARPADLVFTRHGKPFDLSIFGDDVWNPARAKLFPPNPALPADSPLQPKLSRLRRHDLRHSACSIWLRARVDVAICQRWSGHRRLSVFLDVYQGIIPGREKEGIDLLNASLEHLSVHGGVGVGR